MPSSKIGHFTDLDAWKEAHDLVLKIYRLTSRFPTNERFGLVDQLRRAILSVTANLAEGFSRFHYKERVNFYYTARGSVSEVENGPIIARDLSLLTKDEYRELFNRCERIRAIINGLIKATISR